MENDIPLSYLLKTWQPFQRTKGFAFKRLQFKSRQMGLSNAVRQMFCFTLLVIILWIIRISKHSLPFIMDAEFRLLFDFSLRLDGKDRFIIFTFRFYLLRK